MRSSQIFISIIAVAVMVVAGLVGYQNYLAPTPIVPAAVPGVAAAPAVIAAEGRIVPARDAALSFRISGRVARILVAEGDRVEVGQPLIELETNDLQAQLGQAEAALRAAQAQQDLAPSEAPAAQKTLLAAQVDQAQAARDAAAAVFAEAQLRAPFAGTVIAIPFEIGEVAPPGAPALVLADLGRWRVETLDLREEDAAQLKVGRNVTVKIPALPDQPIEGKIVKLALNASSYQGNVTYSITVDLDELAEPSLRWGMTAYLEIDPK